ncbi:MAG: acyloxyacyl hydrolase [Rickettsiales bacterium]|jgi:hypothetical protein|nr:acyloxyacyl hydrolase [Rickettsiales bacterium]
MKKLLFLICTLHFPFSALGANPMLGDNQNSIRIEGVNMVDWYARDIRVFYLSYAQPNIFFRLPGQRNLQMVYISGRTKYSPEYRPGRLHSVQMVNGETSRDVSQFAWGLTQDVVFLSGWGFYMGAGIGPFVKEYKNDYIGTKFIMGERFFAGYRLNNSFNLELVAHHFSNGHLSAMNKGLDGFGLGIAWNF